jgi:Skp family chaperone for outer membrane proteins
VIDMQKVWKRIIIGVVFLLVMGGVIAVLATNEGLKKAWAGDDTMKVGVADYTRLLKAHSDWKRLEGFDEKIASLEQSMYNSPSMMQKMGSEHMERMQKAQREAEAELRAEIDRLSSDLKKERDALQAQFAGEAKKLQEQMKALQAEAKKAQTAELPPKEENRSYPEQMKSFARDLVLQRDRLVSAKRLELQKKAKERMDEKKARLDGELAAYEAQIARENQQEKLNIQLKFQVTKDDQENARLKEELARISEEEGKLKEKKKVEVAAEIEKYGNDELSKIDKEVSAYKAKVDADIRNQLGGKPPMTTEKPSSAGPTTAQKGFQARAEELAKAFNAKKADMEAKLDSAQTESRKKLEAKKAQLEGHLKEHEKLLMKDMMNNREKLAQAEQERIEKQRNEIEKLQSERDKLYDSMLSSIKEEVSEVARKEKLPLVVGMYVVNIKSVDLTDKTIEKMKQSK